MFGNLSYLFYTLFLTIPLVLLVVLFFYQIIKKNIFPILGTAVIGILIVSLCEPLGIFLKAWQYGTTTTLSTLPWGVKFESYIYVFLGSISMGSITIICLHYQDMKIKNIALQLVKDLLSTKYACWRKK